MRARFWQGASGVSVFAALVIGCGGGGSSSSGSTSTTSTTSTTATTGTTTDPAGEPTCSTAVARSSQVSSQSTSRGSRIEIPESSRERDEDVGVRLHTNFVIRPTASRADTPQGLSPDQVRSAYGVPPGGGSDAIAVVVAYHYAQATADFNVFSTEFGLPSETSATATADTNAVLQVVFATGTQPTANVGWNQEAALDVQWAHAMASGAKIYLVEAASSRLDDLMAAAVVAKGLPGVRQVSMSFGGTETSCEYATYDPRLVQPGVSFFAAAGDTSGERLFPGLSRKVVSVGGTTLNVNGAGARLSETVWSDTGGGISRFSPRPTFQNPVLSVVGRYRSGPDVSAVGDPETGVSVYCTAGSGTDTKWIVFGGSSASTPIIAGIVNTAGRGGDSATVAGRLYSARGTTAIYDITAGSSGSLTAGAGYDIPSGVGTPNGISAF